MPLLLTVGREKWWLLCLKNDIGLSSDRRSPVRTHSQPLTLLDSVKDQSRELSRARILVADDNPAILNHVTNMLQPDYQIIGTVADGNSVCTEVENLGPDLIVLDISMGRAVASRLRNTCATKVTLAKSYSLLCTKIVIL